MMRSLTYRVGLILLLCCQPALADRIVTTAMVMENNQGITSELVAEVVDSDATVLSSYGSAQVEMIQKVGARVHRGDVIAQLDTQFLVLSEQKKRYEIRQTEVQVGYLSVELERLETLSKTHSVNRSELDQISYELATAKTRLSELEISLTEIQRHIALSTIRATGSGFVAETFVRKGEFVSQGDAIARVNSFDDIELASQLPIELLDHIDENAQLIIESELHRPKRIGTASFARVVPEVSVGTGAVTLFVEPEQGLKSQLILGSNLTVTLKIRVPDSLVIPGDALIPRGESSFVYKLKADNSVEKAPVKVLAGVNGNYIVTGALAAGEQVITRGGLGLKAGDVVKVDERMAQL
ncbi:efflux RND transporter periplasmic adaptor subunit [Pseudoalteromonas rubra]|uniref:efflux RND transporter periplasmic adaptor subunit n=1 Tax=Pseudoalteromonas rubra TaxID=43658 RepID=UPI001F0CCD5C|nr:efflux RND transporter periplasmic adaptor subunit [Pseudoalteromonas rubra]